MNDHKTRFRLRQNDKVVGYAKRINNSTFFSKDNYGWNGHPIESNLRDPFTGLFDLNRRAIYSEDIIEFTENLEHKFGLIIYDDILDKFQIHSVDGEDLISNNALTFLNEHRYVWKSNRFIQSQM